MRRTVVPLVLALGLLVAACGGGSGPASGGGDRGGAVLDAQEILDFRLPSVEGPEVDGQDYAGKALALWFWAPW